MLDLSEEFDEENIGTCVKYFERMAPMKMWLEMEIGITGGEEDGVDNTAVKADALYTKPEQVTRLHNRYKSAFKCDLKTHDNKSILNVIVRIFLIGPPGGIKVNNFKEIWNHC